MYFDIKSKLSNFINYTNRLLHIASMIYFKYRKDYPVDDEMMQYNAFYSICLFCSYNKIQPSLSYIYDCELNFKEEGELFQDLLYLYSKWSLGIKEDAIYHYCRIISDLLEKKALEKSTCGYILVPDFLAYFSDVKNYLEELENGQISNKAEKNLFDVAL